MKNFADAPITHQLLQAQNPGNNNSGGSRQDPNFIEYQQEASASLPDSQGLFPDRQQQDSGGNFQSMMYDRNANDSMMRDSCVMYDEPEAQGRAQVDGSHKIPKKSPQKPSQQIPQLNYHASNERSQLSEDDSDGIIDEV